MTIEDLFLYYKEGKKTHSETLKRLKHRIDGAPEHIDAQHAFSMDLDLFGEGSIFQSLNRTVTLMGKEILINKFKQPLFDKKEILKHQEGVQEMKALSDFRHLLYFQLRKI